jgi:bifunctional non-homologous end joining protein LigD
MPSVEGEVDGGYTCCMTPKKSGAALHDYRAKRDFTVTSEPSGQTLGHTQARRFVVQRHRARRTHYDFRLEMNGVLASWAMPKGPSLDPAVRSLAVHVEDHPIEYRDFEGIIPSGEYGAGDVIVWDRGTYTPVGADDPAEAVTQGELHFDLHGEKLRGRFVLVRTRQVGRQEQWLMLHKRDDAAVPGWKPDDEPRSVKSGRTNDEVAADPDATWHGDRPPDTAEEKLGSERHRRARASHTPQLSAARAPASEWQGPTEEELAALGALDEGGTWELQGQTLKLTNLNKVLFPGGGEHDQATKRDLIRYYASIAPVILPYLVERPVNLHRFPNGVDRPGFWHKQVPAYAPRWLTRWRNADARPGESEWYFVLDSTPALAWMANFGAVELHPWTSRLPDVSQPTWALVDIDPGNTTTFDDVVVLARLFRSALEHLGLVGLPKMSGMRGVHVWIPLESGYSFEQTRAWVETLSRAVGATAPDLVSWTWQKSRRSGLARLDYTQNARNKTLVAPYSVRAAPGAPLSVPIEWDELGDLGQASGRWTMDTVTGRVVAVGDPYHRLLGLAQHLPAL